MTGNSVRIHRMETAPYGTNAYMVTCASSQESVLVDAPGQADRILQELQGNRPRYILITHGHFDHTGALKELAARLKVPVAAHSADSGRLPHTSDIFLQDGDSLAVGDVSLEVLHTPGHTPGSLCFLVGDVLFSGDTLFPGGPGRTATPSDFQRILDSLTSKVFILPNKTRVLPGHGEPTILEKEKDEFAVFSRRTHSPGLCGDVLWLSS
jgi:glyoxylase-like metal-dependent hydrolase (beta-lactamase superfamily II)